MASDVIMPKMGYDMTEGVIARWLKSPGDPVRRGEAIAEVETDKVNIEIEAFADGTMGSVLVKEGERVPVGTPIATIETGAVADRTELRPVGAGEGGEAVPTQERAGAAEARPLVHPAPAPSLPGAEERPLPKSQAGGPIPATMAEPVEAAPKDVAASGPNRIKASPLARKLASHHGVDLAAVSGTGPGGRVVRADVEARVEQEEVQEESDLLKGATPPAPQPQPPQGMPQPPQAAPQRPKAAPQPSSPAAAGQPVELSRALQAVGRVMTTAKQTIPHFYVTVPVAMDDALTLRQAMNAVSADQAKVGILDLIIKATALALAETPEMRRLYTAEGPVVADGVHVAIAVALPDGAIISPVLHHADKTPLMALAKRSRQLIQAARDGKLSPEAMQGGIFTVSSLGSAGVESFAAIITPPQSGVLAVGSIAPEPVVQDGDIDIEQRMRLTLSADHRLIGGVGAAAFLHRIRDRLAAPYRLLIDTEAPAA